MLAVKVLKSLQTPTYTELYNMHGKNLHLFTGNVIIAFYIILSLSKYDGGGGGVLDGNVQRPETQQTM